jgi:hypothetical protein
MSFEKICGEKRKAIDDDGVLVADRSEDSAQIQRLFDGRPAGGTFGAMALDLTAHLFVVTTFGRGDEGYLVCVPGEGLSIAALAAADTTQNEDDGTAFRTHTTLLLSERLKALKRERGMICRQLLRGSSGMRGVDMLFNSPSGVE